jgi:beta-mannosidase
LFVESAIHVFSNNRHFFKPIKGLSTKNAELQFEGEIVDSHTIQFKIHAKTFSYFAHFCFENENAILSDNYFDSRPGKNKIVTIRHDGMRDPKEFELKTI